MSAIALLFVHRSTHCSTDGNHVGQTWLTLVQSRLFLITSPWRIQKCVSRGLLSWVSQGAKWGWLAVCSLDSSLGLFWRDMHHLFVFIQPSELSTDFHHLSKMTESGTARILAISWPSMDIACNVLWSSTGQVLTSNPHFLLVVLIIEPFLLNREAWEILFVRTEAKMILIQPYLCLRSHTPCNNGATVSLFVLLVLSPWYPLQVSTFGKLLLS